MYLSADTILNNRYEIESVLGHGGFGITYAAHDKTLDVRVAIKEYLPRQLATRGEGQTQVAVFTGEARQQYDYGLRKFLEEARSVARFANHPNVVSARDYFEANGTAYMVMEYIEGVTFKQFLQQKGGRIPFELASQMMMPVMDALREVHVTGLLHRDISPDNVYITADGRIKLLDFGAARYFTGEQSKSLSVILKTGYAPEEQYRSKGRQGPWTDVYASAATMYRAITGRTPPDALDRKEEDTLEPPSQLGIAITPAAEQALMKALAVNAQSRFQDMGEFQAALRSEAIMPSSPTAQVSSGFTPPYHAPPQWSPVSTAAQIPSQPGPVRRKKASSAATAIIISVAVFVLVGSGVLWYLSKIHAQVGVPQGQTAPPVVVVDPHKAFVPATTQTVPDSPGRRTDKPAAVTTGPRWPWTASRLVTSDELASVSADELTLMRNEIYARHGWIFRRQDLQEYFQRQPWYRPQGGLNRQVEVNKAIALNLNSFEKKNADLILGEQTKRGRP